MPTYVMLTNLTADGVRTLKNNPGRVAEVNKEVEQIGAKVLAQYATLGQYDFITIVEAPDEKTMAKVSVELGSRGTMTSQTLSAIPAEAECLPAIGADDVGAIVAAAKERGVDLVAIGPEAALVAGAVDALADAGVPAFGPSAAAAELE